MHTYIRVYISWHVCLLTNAACSERVAEQLERIKLAFCFSKLLANHLSP